MVNEVKLQAKQKLNQLVRNYQFKNIIFDDWRGYRFIYDSDEVKNCKNDCNNCKLYNLLKDEPEGIFSAGLYLASDRDISLFGNQKFLNCKTLEQYANCFINFIVNVTETNKEIEEELKLVKNLELIYASEGNICKKEEEFKRYIFEESLKKSSEEKKIKIIKAWSKLS